ncbi:hypothetical protein NSS91_19020 [Caldifermentibacillus hisashii]|uniref:hypothetical protein n=1 Tax=Caldifermentibacillus hisashii TaxID=996558 RepID=UPI0031FD410A
MHIIFLFFIIPFLVIVLLFVDFYFGRKQHLQNMHIYQFPMRHSNIDIFINGIELFRQMVQDMKTARHHIHVQFYIFRDDPFGSLVLDFITPKFLLLMMIFVQSGQQILIKEVFIIIMK